MHVHVHVHSQSTMHEQISCNLNWEEEIQYDQKSVVDQFIKIKSVIITKNTVT